ncbi:hypothetical protein HHL11_30750 [Ramlibacter sp. G-1-2-2]|uniref:Uncharacterized protein n=1 Tax=Ramlibacter agri TaxID=2728837 RepID=A0A848HKA3_9BURK|nr:hypothetical protein [Ramlibacter agri]NML48168.1 hypothetical protein [Ramlibacter agri]
MPDAKNNAKLTGDTHLPDVDDGDATPEARLRDDEDMEEEAGEEEARSTPGKKKQPAAGKGKPR